MTEASREQEARSMIWWLSGSGSMSAVWEQYAQEMAIYRNVPLYEALELVLPEVTSSEGNNWYWERVCIVCGQQADWWKSVQLFVYYGFCDEHACQEDDFKPDEYPWTRPF